MLDPHPVEIESTREWFARQRSDPQIHLFLFELGGIPSGYVRFQLAKATGIADWGFYRAPGAPAGMGARLGRAALAHAFEILSAHKVCGRVLAFNDASIRFHERLGFVREGTLREQHFDGEMRHDLICFGLLAQEWFDLCRHE
jgi:RimJ/RimL family protein N-acetyltransferase